MTVKSIKLGINRRFNTIKEWTQAVIAFLVVLTSCVGTVLQYTFPPEWWVVLGLVVGFYFGKVQTNNSNVTAEEK